jgi:hypothetical protein
MNAPSSIGCAATPTKREFDAIIAWSLKDAEKDKQRQAQPRL